ncbi:GNAT family N-acetyltransferase [Flavobacterium silvaticum]|uniref:GNAT family N-acetyltransferase n=1 Tax=Flavobacterium silvaticum TaxID=1852020 RepID=A0A972JH25_9FLAO|nr:GNAT family N-acetyltransferase [Flavobacterium silvaticum]NMH27495.1 GNAT family N-acetyltransferase [Flavobacterium silvaticum]
MPQIRPIHSIQTYAVRHPVLRPGKPVETCVFDGDDLNSTSHFGLFDNSELRGVASLFRNNHPGFREERQFQLRGMAVLEEYQGFGYGRQLVQSCEDETRRRAGELLWFNAREGAVGFYENMGYKITGKAFLINGIGMHYVMFKRI